MVRFLVKVFSSALRTPFCPSPRGLLMPKSYSLDKQGPSPVRQENTQNLQQDLKEIF